MFFELLVLVVVEVVGRIIRKIYSFFYDRFRRLCFQFSHQGGTGTRTRIALFLTKVVKVVVDLNGPLNQFHFFLDFYLLF